MFQYYVSATENKYIKINFIGSKITWILDSVDSINVWFHHRDASSPIIGDKVDERWIWDKIFGSYCDGSVKDISINSLSWSGTG